MKKIIDKYNSIPIAVRASLFFIICSVLQKGISFITIPLFTRMLSTEEYGIYSLFLSYSDILGIFVTLNLSYQIFNNGMVKFKHDKDGYATSMVGLTLFSSIFYFIIFFIVGIFFKKILFFSVEYFLLMILYVCFSSIFGIWLVRQRYDYKYKAASFLTIFNSIINPLLGILLLYFYKKTASVRILSLVFTTIITGLISFLFILKKNRHLVNIEYWKFALKLDLPLIPHYISMSVLDSSDKIMISNMISTSATALYSVSYNIAMVMYIFLNAINSTLNPWLYQKLDLKDYKTININTLYVIFFVMILTIIPMIMGPEVLTILGSSEYVSAANVIPVASCGIFMIFIYSLFLNVELYYEKSNLVLIGSLCAAGINIFLNFIFIKKFGYIAAAYTTLVSYVFLSIFHYLGFKKICKVNEIKSDVFNIKLISLLCITLILISVSIHYLYKFIFLRYSILFIFLLCFIIFKNNIILFINKLKEKK